jgi:isopentenyl-diphosphate delta-isomerase type 1
MLEDEVYDVVDEDDNIIGKKTRRDIHKDKLIHRSAIFFIFDKKGRIFVNQRSESKKFFPGHWSICFGGHVNSGESYEEAAVRECKEETGLEGKPFYMGYFKHRHSTENENQKVFGFITDKEPKLDLKELQRGRFMTIQEVKKFLKEKDFLPETKDHFRILEDYIKNSSQL